MEPKSKFKNTSGGVAGAVQLDHQNEAKGVAVYPGESVWLTEREQVLTANAPRNEEDNPFTNGTFTLEVKAEDVAHSRPIGDTQVDPAEQPPEPEPAPEPEPEDPNSVEITDESAGAEVGAAEPPEGPAPEGQPALHEEVAEAEAPGEPVGEPVEELVEEQPRSSPKPLPPPKAAG